MIGTGSTPVGQRYALDAQEPFFKSLNSGQLQLVAESALEMQLEPGQFVFVEGRPACLFYLILEGKMVLESEMADRKVVPVQTLGPGDELGWSLLFRPCSFQLKRSRHRANQNDILLPHPLAGPVRARS